MMAGDGWCQAGALRRRAVPLPRRAGSPTSTPAHSNSRPNFAIQLGRYREFWLAQSSFLEALFRSRLATAAAIRGACPAGGTCVALCCDARFGTPNASLGLNEVGGRGGWVGWLGGCMSVDTWGWGLAGLQGQPQVVRQVPPLWHPYTSSQPTQAGHQTPSPPPTPSSPPSLAQVALGIPVPKFWGALMARAIGPAPADRLLLGGAMAGAPEAARLGLLDGVAPSNSQGDVLALASAWVEAACKLPPAARAATKQSARAEFCAAWREYYTTEEPAYGWAAISDPAAVATMGRVMARLSGGGGGGKGGAAGASKL